MRILATALLSAVLMTLVGCASIAGDNTRAVRVSLNQKAQRFTWITKNMV